MAMSNVTKTVAVFKRSQYGYTDYANFIPFDLSDDDSGMVRRTVVMARKDVDDLGWPDEITVTIEPGDKLNEKSP